MSQTTETALIDQQQKQIERLEAERQILWRRNVEEAKSRVEMEIDLICKQKEIEQLSVRNKVLAHNLKGQTENYKELRDTQEETEAKHREALETLAQPNLSVAAELLLAKAHIALHRVAEDIAIKFDHEGRTPTQSSAFANMQRARSFLPSPAAQSIGFDKEELLAELGKSEYDREKLTLLVEAIRIRYECTDIIECAGESDIEGQGEDIEVYSLLQVISSLNSKRPSAEAKVTNKRSSKPLGIKQIEDINKLLSEFFDLFFI